MKRYIAYFVAAFICALVFASLVDDTEIVGSVEFDRDGIKTVEVARIGEVVEVRVTTYGASTCSDVMGFLEISTKEIAGAHWIPECRIKKPDYIVIRFEKWKYAY